MPNCELCGEPMPSGEEMFKYHGSSGPCPKPPMKQPPQEEQLSVQHERMQMDKAEIEHLKYLLQSLSEWFDAKEVKQMFSLVGSLKLMGHVLALPEPSKEFQDKYYPILKQLKEEFPVKAQ